VSNKDKARKEAEPKEEVGIELKESQVPARAPAPSRAGIDRPAEDPFARKEGRATEQFELPRIVLLQPLSVESKREDDRIPPGYFINRMNGEKLGKSLTFVPFKHLKTRVRMEQGQGLQCRSVTMFTAQMLGGRDIKTDKPTRDCETCKFRLWPDERMEATGENLQGKALTGGPECSIVDNFLAIQTDREDGKNPWIVLQFQRTSAKAARRLLTMWGSDEGLPLSAFAYKVYSSEVPSGGDQTYWRQDLNRVRASTDEEKAKVVSLMEKLGEVVVEDVSEEEYHGASSASGADREAVAAQKGF